MKYTILNTCFILYILTLLISSVVGAFLSGFDTMLFDGRTAGPAPEVQDEAAIENRRRTHEENRRTNGGVNKNHFEALPDDCVFIAGGGPVGMTTATVLAFYGVRSIVLERNKSTTKYPLILYIVYWTTRD